MTSDKPAGSKKPINVELLLAISATLLSLGALVIAIFQTKIAREQQQMSVWPHLQVAYAQDNDVFTWSVTNNGVGPAIIKSVALTYQGKAYKTHYDLLFEQIERFKANQTTHMDISDMLPGYVIKTDGEITLGQIKNSVPVANAMRQIIVDSSFHFRVIYSDVYGNCWQNDHDQVTQLANCPDK